MLSTVEHLLTEFQTLQDNTGMRGTLIVFEQKPHNSRKKCAYAKMLRMRTIRSPTEREVCRCIV